MKFDICLMNPPYANGLGEKFFLKGLQLANINVSILPSTWLLGKKQNKNLTYYFDKFGGTIEQVDGNKFFDAAIGGVMSINYNNQNIIDKILFDEHPYNKCNEITKFSNDRLLMEFFNKVRPDKLSDNLHLHVKKEPGTKGFASCPVENNPNPNWWIIRLTVFAGDGHSAKDDKKNESFYTLISRSQKFNDACGQYKDLIKLTKSYNGYEKPYIEYYIAFNTENELKNFWNYIHTDFVRTCLYFIKSSMNLQSGELKYIPWFDFSNPIFTKSPLEIDDYLFNKYNISDDIRKHIEDILPDYYGIRK